MKEGSNRYLQKFYDSYRDNLDMKKKLISKSVLLSSLRVKNNVRFTALNESAIVAAKIPSDVLFELKQNGWVRDTEDMSTVTISAKGIWYIEKRNGILGEEALLDFIDDNYFAMVEASKPLSEKEKVIIFGMLTTRAFSINSAVDMRKDDSVKDTWKEVMISAFEKLKELGAVERLEIVDLMPTQGIEHPASHLIRHTDSLPRKTRAIFKASGKNKYYLDMYVNDSLSTEKLAYLFWLVFGRLLDSDNVEKISEYCREVAYNKSIYVFDLDEHKFSTPEYDELIRTSIIDSIIMRSQWDSE
ncbi:MAG: hypothetical protein GXX95_11735 [Methanomassiliicoccus sp.]|nr:hypothetical protein [Methanomassiliicoccus sp.]